MIAGLGRCRSQVVLMFECPREAFESSMVTAAEVRAELVKRAAGSVAPDGQAIEVQLEPRAAKEVRVCSAGDPLDLDVDMRDEQLRIDEGAHAPGRRRVFGEGAAHVGGLRARIDTEWRLARTTLDTKREAMRVVSADAETAGDAPPAQGFVRRVEIQVTVTRAARIAGAHAEREGCGGECIELLGGPHLVAEKRSTGVARRTAAQRRPTQELKTLLSASFGVFTSP